MAGLQDPRKTARWHNIYLCTTVTCVVTTILFASLFGWSYHEWKMQGIDNVTPQHLIISVADQKAYFYKNGTLNDIYQVSTSSKGVGQVSESGKTPLGLHEIAEKDAGTAPYACHLSGRRCTGDIVTIEYRALKPSPLKITTRVLRLKGLVKGFNSGKNSDEQSVDTFNRYIYLQGSNADGMLGTPVTEGAIHFSNLEIMRLFDAIGLKSHVDIIEGSHRPYVC